jgi:hypothetical protein
MSERFYTTGPSYMDSITKDLFQKMLFYVVCVVVLSAIVYILYKVALKVVGGCGKAYESFQLKESMSPNSRWNRTARYLNTYNGLVSEKKQYTSDKVIPPDPNQRGDHMFHHLLKREEGKVQTNGSPESVSVVGINTRSQVPDTAALSPEVQRGIIENASNSSDYVNPRTNPANLVGAKLSNGNKEGGLSIAPEGFDQRRRN